MRVARLLVFCGLSSPLLAQAQWVEVKSTEPAAICADPASRQSDGELTKMWELGNYRQTQDFAGQPFFSSRVLCEFDCQAHEMRTLAFTTFTRRMAAGDMVHTHRVKGPDWQLVEPYSVGEASWQLACAQ